MKLWMGMLGAALAGLLMTAVVHQEKERVLKNTNRQVLHPRVRANLHHFAQSLYEKTQSWDAAVRALARKKLEEYRAKGGW